MKFKRFYKVDKLRKNKRVWDFNYLHYITNKVWNNEWRTVS